MPVLVGSVVTAILGCAAPEPAAPVARVHPDDPVVVGAAVASTPLGSPTGPSVSGVALHAGRRADVRIGADDVRGPITLFGGTVAGRGPCPNDGPVCVGIVDAEVLGSADVDADGIARIRFDVPLGAPAAMLLQAVVPETVLRLTPRIEAAVVHSAPVIDAVTLDPPVATAAGPLTAVVAATDPDGDAIALHYRWRIDGTDVPNLDGPTLPAVFRRGQTVGVEVGAVANGETGLTARSEVVIADAPPIVVARITPSAPILGRDRLDCDVEVSDPDGDPIAVDASWRSDRDPAGGAPRPGSMVAAADTVVGGRWTCAVTATTAAATTVTETSVTPIAAATNVLVLLADDIGVDRIAAWDANPTPTPTPRIDQLAAEGLRFDRAYVTPLCSPSRAMLLSGKYNRRLGIGYIVDSWAQQYGLPVAEVSLAEVAALGKYDPGFVGKWHVGTATSGPTHPGDVGFDWYRGTLSNLADPPGFKYDYDRWQVNDNGVLGVSTTYATTASVDDALLLTETLAEPWLVYVAFNAAHSPYTAPPDALVPADLPIETDADRYDRVVAALDAEIGRLMDQIDPSMLERTTVVFLADNGTPQEAVRPPLDPRRAKESIYEGGTRVPLIVRSPLVAVPGTSTDVLVSGIDLLPTVAVIAGVDPAEVVRSDGSPAAFDGVSLLPWFADRTLPGPRDTIFTEVFSVDDPGAVDDRRHRDESWTPNGRPPYAYEEVALRDEAFKLIRKRTGDVVVEELYDLRGVDFEGEDLLLAPLGREAGEAYDRLGAGLDAELGRLTFDVPNGIPRAVGLTVVPELPVAGEPLKCVVGEIVDDDADTGAAVTVSWDLDGVEYAGDTLAGALVTAGATATCRAFATDELVSGPVAELTLSVP
ncbi:MAG: sulfatase-like hydrolase/transferase [Myxococcota bacterium]